MRTQVARRTTAAVPNSKYPSLLQLLECTKGCSALRKSALLALSANVNPRAPLALANLPWKIIWQSKYRAWSSTVLKWGLQVLTVLGHRGYRDLSRLLGESCWQTLKKWEATREKNVRKLRNSRQSGGGVSAEEMVKTRTNSSTPASKFKRSFPFSVTSIVLTWGHDCLGFLHSDQEGVMVPSSQSRPTSTGTQGRRLRMRYRPWAICKRRKKKQILLTIPSLDILPWTKMELSEFVQDYRSSSLRGFNVCVCGQACPLPVVALPCPCVNTHGSTAGQLQTTTKPNKKVMTLAAKAMQQNALKTMYRCMCKTQVNIHIFTYLYTHMYVYI